MRSNGSFSSIVGVTFIILLASIAVAFYANSLSQSAFVEQQNILELRQRWTEARFMLDKTAAKALYLSDTGSTRNCAIDAGENYESGALGVNALFPLALQLSEKNGKCAVESLAVTSSGTDFTVSFKLSCSKGSSSYSIPVSFVKRLSGTFPDCAVTDVQGNFAEIP